MLFENTTAVAFDPAHFVIECRGRTLDCRPGLRCGAHVMGILNVTPDSFSDGGRFLPSEAAMRHVETMLDEGAALVDVGGESSRPAGSVYGDGASAVGVDEEMSRVLPVVQALVERRPEALISVDTYKPEVAEAVLEAGAHVINDITGLRYTTETASLSAEYGAAMVLMHSLARPGDPPTTREYDDVVHDVFSSLAESVARAEKAGVRDIIVDPGIGFGKTPVENLRLIKHVQVFLQLGRPVLVGASRKSSIGRYLGSPDAPAPVDERLYGSLGAAAAAVMRGATIIRAHDVRPTVELLKIIGAVHAS